MENQKTMDNIFKCYILEFNSQRSIFKNEIKIMFILIKFELYTNQPIKIIEERRQDTKWFWTENSKWRKEYRTYKMLTMCVNLNKYCVRPYLFGFLVKQAD